LPDTILYDEYGNDVTDRYLLESINGGSANGFGTQSGADGWLIASILALGVRLAKITIDKQE